jgi:hypothetical protein
MALDWDGKMDIQTIYEISVKKGDKQSLMVKAYQRKHAA